MLSAFSGGSLRFGMLARVVATVAALGLWFWTQSLIGRRAPAAGINDALHNLFAGLNSYFGQHTAAANVLLIVSCGLVDIPGSFLVAECIFLGRSRAFLGLVLLLGLRQIMQALCALPAPPNMIWHYPGVPSLFVTYNVGNDYFFSGTRPSPFRRNWPCAPAASMVDRARLCRGPV